MPPALLKTSPCPKSVTRAELPGVTLVAATGVALSQTARALAQSLAQVRCAATLLLSDRPPPSGTPDAITWRRIPPIRSHAAYSRFMLHDLVDHVATPHVLCVQWDGYVLDARGWDPAFLEYDYVGAPWPQFNDGHTVGNGGFSLRSRRLLEACRAIGIDDAAEDIAICRTWRPTLERDFALRFAPEPVARRFAYERFTRAGGEFGFHGVFNLIDLVGPAAFVDVIATLEPGVLNRREHRELLREGAASRGRFGLARTVLWRLNRSAPRRT